MNLLSLDWWVSVFLVGVIINLVSLQIPTLLGKINKSRKKRVDKSNKEMSRMIQAASIEKELLDDFAFRAQIYFQATFFCFLLSFVINNGKTPTENATTYIVISRLLDIAASIIFLGIGFFSFRRFAHTYTIYLKARHLRIKNRYRS